MIQRMIGFMADDEDQVKQAKKTATNLILRMKGFMAVDEDEVEKN